MESKKTHLISMNLPVLQNALKRDPESYKEEFLSKYEQCQSMLSVFQLKSSRHNEALVSSVLFNAQVVHCYRTSLPEVQQFPGQLIDVLKHHGPDMDPDMRMTFCKALISLRNNKMVAPMELFDIFFKLFSCQDKVLRKMMYNFIVQDIKNVNTRQKNVQLNKALQNYMFKWMDSSSAVITKMCVDIMVELYRRRIWNDERTVNVIAKSLTSKHSKVVSVGLKFFLGVNEIEDDSEEEDDDDSHKKTLKELEVGYRVGKKSKKRQKRLDRAKAVLKKHKKKHKADVVNFSALHLLNDPQELAERVFARVNTSSRIEKFEVELLMANLVSRLIGIHQLILLNFYDYLMRHLKPSETYVTKFLLFAAQASHDLVPPECLENVIQVIASNFITDRNSDDAIAVGLNAVREICTRCPLAMSKDLLDDLVEYKKNRGKGVMMAARSLVTLFREKNPHLLHKTNRGRLTEAMRETKVLDYGQLNAVDYLPGAEVLNMVEENQEPQDQNEWESCSEEDHEDSDGSWVDVNHSSDEETKDVKKEEADDPVKMAENVEKARAVMQSRIFTDEDFNKIKARQVSKEVDGRSASKRTLEQMSGQKNDKEIPSLEAIECIPGKRMKHDYEARMASVMSGREGRQKYGKREKRMNPHASTSNRDKRKSKAFMMVKHKIRQKKGKRTFQQKRDALKQALIRKQKSKK